MLIGAVCDDVVVDVCMSEAEREFRWDGVSGRQYERDNGCCVI